MKTKITSSLLMLIICITVKAQNLIPNGDFELGPDSSSMGWQYGIWDTTGGGCSPTVFVTGPNLWTVVTGSPDRLVNGHMPPCNWDNDTAQSGNAYAVFGEKFAVATLPEVGKATLLMPLQKDSAYHLSYYVKLETFSHLTFQPVRIAFVFNNNGDSLASSFVSDTIWQYRDTIFMASANSTEIEITGADSSLSAVDVDNVKLEKISSNGVEDYINQEKFNIYPNPVKDILFIVPKKLLYAVFLDLVLLYVRLF
ncbi:MAG: hypothetical protein WCP85_31795, partial [Mariniphaga sp.]